MTDREQNWASIREVAHSYAAPGHLSDEQVRQIASALCAGLSPWPDYQSAMGALPEHATVFNDD